MYNYIVCGHNRTGTNMMAKSLHLGGLPIQLDEKFNTERFEMYKNKAYHMQPGGFYEANSEVHRMKPGHILKLVPAYLFDIPDGNYKVICMQRPSEEILMSVERYMRNVFSGGIQTIEHGVNKINKFIESRSDMSVLYVNYKDVIANPRDQFIIIKNFLEVDLDVNKAASVVDPSLYRNRVG